MYKLIASGNLVNDPTYRLVTKKNGTKSGVINFTLAVHWYNGAEKKTDFLRCASWYNGLETEPGILKHLKKGKGLEITGIPQADSYVGSDGTTRNVLKVTCETLEFSPWNSTGRQTVAADDPSGDQEIQAMLFPEEEALPEIPA